jgi:hypothetical protein
MVTANFSQLLLKYCGCAIRGTLAIAEQDRYREGRPHPGGFRDVVEDFDGLLNMDAVSCVLHWGRWSIATGLGLMLISVVCAPGRHRLRWSFALAVLACLHVSLDTCNRGCPLLWTSLIFLPSPPGDRCEIGAVCPEWNAFRDRMTDLSWSAQMCIVALMFAPIAWRVVQQLSWWLKADAGAGADATGSKADATGAKADATAPTAPPPAQEAVPPPREPAAYSQFHVNTVNGTYNVYNNTVHGMQPRTHARICADKALRDADALY